MTDSSTLPPRRRSWGIFVPALLLLAVAIGWSGFWYWGATAANRTISDWLEREAALGRVYRCGEQDIGGFPFRFELRCSDATGDLRSLQPPLHMELKGLLVASQVYQPTLLISEFTGPLRLAEPGQPARYETTWSLAQTSVRGTPSAPERISVVLDDFAISELSGSGPGPSPMLSGRHIEAHVRLAEGALRDNPVFDLALQLRDAMAPRAHPAIALPTDADIDLTLRGLRDLSPKPWPQPLRELQAANGRIEVKRIRFRQGETIVVAAGNLGLTASGRLNGELQMTAAGLDRLLPRLGIDNIVPPSGGERVNAAISFLDKLAPGLGQVARERAGVGLAAGIAMIGEPTELEGRRAVRLPLRFNDGMAYLGPVPIGQTQPLF